MSEGKLKRELEEFRKDLHIASELFLYFFSSSLILQVSYSFISFLIIVLVRD